MGNLSFLLASKNEGKVKEIQRIFESDLCLKVSLKPLPPEVPTAEEPFETFLENALHKARTYGTLLEEITLSEDSGLCINVLNGFPGVRTKEYFETNIAQKGNFSHLENLLENMSSLEASFHCVAVLYFPPSLKREEKFFVGEGLLKGYLSFPPKGQEGFGFDPIFTPEGWHQTLAQLGTHVKNKISHRFQAIKKLGEQVAPLIPDL